MQASDEIGAAATAATGRHALWDLPTRLFHWALVALVAFSWWSGEHHDMDRHRLSGYAILALLLFRAFWGFAGGRTARFAQFVRGPGAVAGYVRSLFGREHARAFGHNPLGGWSVLAMLAALAAMVASGLFSVDVDGLESGPLADYVSFDTGRLAAGAHAWCLDVVLALVAIHVLAIVFYAVALRHDLVGPMVTGRRPVRAGDAAAVEDLRSRGWLALIGIAGAAAIAWAVSRSFRF